MKVAVIRDKEIIAMKQAQGMKVVTHAVRMQQTDNPTGEG